jgi:hypothetical protein
LHVCSPVNGPSHSLKPTWHPLIGPGFPSIQSAIAAATDKDIISLTGGSFTGDRNRDIDHWGQATTVRSQGADS